MLVKFSHYSTRYVFIIELPGGFRKIITFLFYNWGKRRWVFSIYYQHYDGAVTRVLAIP